MRGTVATSPELELLDQLAGGRAPYLLMERHVFDGDRSRALRSIENMLAEGLIELAIGGRQVEGGGGSQSGVRLTIRRRHYRWIKLNSPSRTAAWNG